MASDPFIGELRVFSFNFAPQYWASCDGQLLPINQNQALFSLLGTQYGGDGQTTFALPDLRSRVPVGSGRGLIQGQPIGEEQHTLSLNEMTTHTHLVQASTTAATAAAPGGNLPASAPGLYSSRLGSAVTLANATTTNVGQGQSHENRQPYLVLNVCIALTGIYPSRN